MIERFFGLRALGTTPAVEVRAGATTFLTMAYILFVNPQILGAAGLPPDDVVVATALASAIACFVMGLYARYPFALAPGMGLNAYFAFGVVLGLGVSWQVALTAVFVEGILFLLLSFCGIRTALLDSIPQSLKLSAVAGIGLFLAFIGLQNAGLVVDDGATLVRLGDVSSPSGLLVLAGLLAIAVLRARRVPGSILVVLGALSAAAWLTGLSPAPQEVFTTPRLPSETLFAFDFRALLSAEMATAVAAFLLVDLLDTAGTLIGVGHLGGFLDEEGRLERADRAFVADALGTTVGAALGTSTVTTYVESAAGVEEGGRSGLTSVVVGALFLLSLVFVPIFVAVPVMATAPVLILVGASMMRSLAGLEWGRLEESIPAFLCVAVMPLTFSIANGLAIGLVSWVGIRLLSGRWRDVAPPLWVITVLLLVFFALGDPR